MIAFGLRSTAKRTRRIQVHSPELRGVKSEWMTSGEDPSLSPTIFLVEQPAGMVLPAHCHRNNQFQLVVAGTGKIGPNKLGPVTIHYAGAYTAYGPLAAGPDGLKYFIIRSVHESGMQVVAETAQAAWPKGPRSHATSKRFAVLSDDALAQVTHLHTTIDRRRQWYAGRRLYHFARLRIESPPLRRIGGHLHRRTCWFGGGRDRDVSRVGKRVFIVR